MMHKVFAGVIGQEWRYLSERGGLASSQWADSSVAGRHKEDDCGSDLSPGVIKTKAGLLSKPLFQGVGKGGV